MNVQELLVETLGDDDAWGHAQWPDPIGRITEEYRRRKRRRLAVVGAAALAVVAGTAAGLAQLSPDRNTAVVQPGDPDGGPTAASSRTVVMAGVSWTITATPSPAGPCVGVTAANGGTIGGGCGHSDNPNLRWGEGGLRVHGTFYNVVYGVAPPHASVIRASLADGQTLLDDGLGDDGLWMFARAAASTARPDGFTSVVVLDSAGREITHQDLPSLPPTRAGATVRIGAWTFHAPAGMTVTKPVTKHADPHPVLSGTATDATLDAEGMHLEITVYTGALAAGEWQLELPGDTVSRSIAGHPTRLSHYQQTDIAGVKGTTADAIEMLVRPTNDSVILVDATGISDQTLVTMIRDAIA